ncbi:MAG: hypothetical protein EAZ60_09505 [Oscillatoriales cyanobacterium]|nr:MAG: hypothetical protein EAZ83_09860 [Oscillatoriales cyanobacterium]TAE95968.1 MAG: hypothetical protein EAZ79_16370 [Oscillatoriales cyanobacterium]TAF19600.1 MAG: hypothetical protein EAZ73_15035 [Oscillatoriales cyanobacterium]TAF30591.1 MAG: hypothetical protein EAZ69_21745 [Oscillatoriales cyanobacterium]TAF56524.1 MAG: hypothetical protein EAZ60_09505 [Oscillatoriales cyanobacterium]
MPEIHQESGKSTSFKQTNLRWENKVRNHANVGLISFFLQSAEADFACVAANLFAGLVILLQSAEADFACVAANLFAEDIRQGLVPIGPEYMSNIEHNSIPPRYEFFISIHTVTTGSISCNNF